MKELGKPKRFLSAYMIFVQENQHNRAKDSPTVTTSIKIMWQIFNVISNRSGKRRSVKAGRSCQPSKRRSLRNKATSCVTTTSKV